MTRRVDLPSTEHVRRTMTEIIDEADHDGRRPTVLALARKLGLTNPTFWRHFPDIAAELTAHARTPEAATSPNPTRYGRLQQDNARLARRLAETTADLQAAVASIQRLALDNDQLRRELEAAGNVTGIRLPLGKR